MVTHDRTSGTIPIALISSVGGIARLRPSCVYSLFRLSLPEMNGVPIGQRDVVAGLCGPHERAERLGPLGIAPAEVVEDRDPRRIGADGRAVADRLVDDAARHGVGVDPAVSRVDAAADGQAAGRAADGQDDRRVAGPVVADRRPAA